jgi:DNA-binding LacI/PurR family transcriptional regulator
MAVSQKQIANRLGVSIALVSRVLSGKAAAIGITPATSERVLAMAHEMGYVPSAAALELKGKSTRTIGVAVCEFNDPFFGALIKQIQIQAHQQDYSLILAGFLNRVPDEKDLRALRKHAIDGLIVIGSEADARWLESFAHLRIARIGHGNSAEASVRIAVDEDAAAIALVAHLAAAGRRSALHIHAAQPAHRLRCRALERAAEARGLDLTIAQNTEHIGFDAGMTTTRDMLQSGASYDALVCATDQIAMGALHALYQAGIHPPDAVAVTGFDDIPAAVQFIPPLTTIQQPLEEIVKHAFAAVTTPTSPHEKLLTGTLVVRQST